MMAQGPVRGAGFLTFFDFPVHGARRIFLTNLDLVDILGDTDFDFENFYLLDFLGPHLGPSLGPAWAQLGPGLGPRLGRLFL